ncbi:MAG TPA: hypothetical protein H9964_04240 [Candidatus Gallimonas intestinavium]|uniref:Transposase DDE domain-containing protein n=1 Tax=Candidatus Gallimonas intestinavium TaxID=2838603 RepID=A0A9D2JYV5_9FIRM|nr:hypothetical protein [Candidatus Gallimonas intestinavium]
MAQANDFVKRNVCCKRKGRIETFRAFMRRICGALFYQFAAFHLTDLRHFVGVICAFGTIAGHFPEVGEMPGIALPTDLSDDLCGRNLFLRKEGQNAAVGTKNSADRKRSPRQGKISPETLFSCVE